MPSPFPCLRALPPPSFLTDTKATKDLQTPSCIPCTHIHTHALLTHTPSPSLPLLHTHTHLIPTPNLPFRCADGMEAEQLEQLQEDYEEEIARRRKKGDIRDKWITPLLDFQVRAAAGVLVTGGAGGGGSGEGLEGPACTDAHAPFTWQLTPTMPPSHMATPPMPPSFSLGRCIPLGRR